MAVVTILKGSLSPVTRILTGIPLVFYAFIFKDDLMSLVHVKSIPYTAILKNSVEYAFISLAILWPAVLLFCQNMSESEFSSVVIKMTVFSALITGGFIYLN